MRFSEVIGLRWDRVDLDAMTLTVEETKTGEPPVIPVARQPGAAGARRNQPCARHEKQPETISHAFPVPE